jgi:hypothetical protein
MKEFKTLIYTGCIMCHIYVIYGTIKYKGNMTNYYNMKYKNHQIKT